MAANKVNTIVDSWKTNAKLNLSSEQEEKLKALFTSAIEKVRARREAGKQVIEQLQTATQNNDSAAVEQLLQKLREGLRQAGEGRERVLDEFDNILQAEQRARILLYVVQKAKESGKPVEHLVDTLLSQDD